MRGESWAEWEHRLVTWAYQAVSSEALEAAPMAADVDWAYAVCEGIIQRYSRSFALASSLLTPEKRRAVRALYAFCRVTDDLVDAPRAEPRAALAQWRVLALSPQPPADEPVLVAWADARRRYRIPRGYVEQFLDGVARDLDPRPYETFAELAAYCYGVASTVGLMSLAIIGYTDSSAIPYAVRLGVALQLTNILRDVGEDWRAGRLYLPREELRAFGISEAQIAEGRVDSRWRAFMHFQIMRARRLYAAALPGLRWLFPQGRVAIRAAAELYQGILGAIERNGYDVFTRRAALSPMARLWIALRAWWAERRAGDQGTPSASPPAMDAS
ncbi:MAG: phytoene/squalene synthase family protein [Thermoflexus sp.]|jgi:15-cis-phytoene synthase|nr:phytoene/squalene synthase family protein [Thermoflexus sp.]